ncbi:site-specific integrase [Novosphingobium sp.]|uniref:tyrosine-type recombinase/integrase n=1 Tax=Novosphingobium sp. TaxID=1874826 RepID=UPI0026076AAB|nr:site-specific integrase [Novosphingobium sp.]
MSILKDKRSPYYHYSFVIAGRRYHGSTKCKTKAKALMVEQKIRENVMLGGARRPSISLGDACKQYEDTVAKQPSWPTTRYILRELVKGVGANKALADIGPMDLRRFYRTRAIKRSASTVNREIDVARAVWRLADESRFDVGDMPTWHSFRCKEQRRPARELSADEEVKLFQHLRSDVRDAVEFMLKSGWRRNEVLDLKWSDCDLEDRRAITRIKGGDVVSRALTATLCGIIARQPNVGPYVFTYQCQRTNGELRKGRRYKLTPTALRGAFKAALAKAGVTNFRTHDLRHTCATRIVRATGSIAAAKEALKHRSINTTMRYSHVLDDDVRNALERAESRNSVGVSFPQSANA